MEAKWEARSHAYGSAKDIPGLLLDAETDLRPGHEPGSTWFQLWSALCHQGEVYTASYAAVPTLIDLALLPQYQHRYDPVLLAGSIELARLEGSGPPIPDDLAATYHSALQVALKVAEKALQCPLDRDSIQAYKGSAAAFRGDMRAARDAFDADP
jgi:hypothetical protein